MPPTNETELNSLFDSRAEMEYTPCTLCGADDFEVYCDVRSKRFPEETFRLVRCRRCGQIYTNPRPTAEAMGRYYDAEYAFFGYLDHLLTVGSTSAVEVLKSLGYRTMASLKSSPAHPTLCRLLSPLSWILSQKVGGFPEPRVARPCLLDVGCGDGYFLYFLQRAGWDCAGVEINPTAAERGRSHGLDIKTGTLDESTFPGMAEIFDVVRFWHSLEHIHEPVIALRAAHRLLRPGGCVLIGVPNAAGLAARMCGSQWTSYDVPLHLSHYTRETLRQLLRRTEFQSVSIRTYSVGDLVPAVALLGLRVRSIASGARAADQHEVRVAAWPGRIGLQLACSAAVFPTEVMANVAGQGDSLEAVGWKLAENAPREGGS